MTTTRDAMSPFFEQVKDSPFRIAAERADELRTEVMAGTEWEFEMDDGPAQFRAIPPDHRVLLSSAGLASLWCFCQAAFVTMDIGSRMAALGTESETDLGELWAKERLRSAVDYAVRLFEADEDWPDDVPFPQWDAAFESAPGRVNNLFLAAVSWGVLHEIAHVHYDHAEYVGRELRLSQEHQADRFAIHWSLERATGALREFRVVSMAIAMGWLLLFERAKRGGVDHPPAILRFKEAASWFDADEDSPALENAVYALKAIFDPVTAMPVGMSPIVAFEWLEGRLTALFPR